MWGAVGEAMPDAGSRVVFQGVTYAVKSRTGDTLECYPLGCADKTTGEAPLFMAPYAG